MLVFLALGGGVLAAGCGGGDSSTTGDADGASSGPATSAASSDTGSARSTDKIEIADFKYGPDAVTIAAGTEITWTNADQAAHTATADDGSFDTGDLERGDSASASLDQPGTYSYFCRFHPFMKATVEVQ